MYCILRLNLKVIINLKIIKKDYFLFEKRRQCEMYVNKMYGMIAVLCIYSKK